MVEYGSKLIEWIENPGLLNKESLSLLRNVLDEYPCFTPARVLYLKNLYKEKNTIYSSELSRTSVYVPDRKRLFDFIEGRLDSRENAAEKKTDRKPDDFSIIDRFLLNPEFSTATENAKASDIVDVRKDSVSNDDYSESSERLQATGNEGFALDYIGYLSMQKDAAKPEESVRTAETSENATVPEPMYGQEYIDAFLADSSSEKLRQGSLYAKPDFSTSHEKNAEESDAESVLENMPQGTFTETLAKIYIKQKRYDKALEILRSLSLKNPEKNIYFADQIRFLEKLLIINTKKQ